MTGPAPGAISIVPLAGLPEVRPGDDLGSLIGDALARAGGLAEDDVVVVAHKVVSKAEGRTERADDELAVVLREARAVFPDTEIPRDFDIIDVRFQERGGPRLVKAGALARRDAEPAVETAEEQVR